MKMAIASDAIFHAKHVLALRKISVPPALDDYFFMKADAQIFVQTTILDWKRIRFA